METTIEKFSRGTKKVLEENNSVFQTLVNKASDFAVRQTLYSMMDNSFKEYQKYIAFDLRAERTPAPPYSFFENKRKAYEMRKTAINEQIAKSFGLKPFLTSEQITAISSKALKNNEREFLKFCLKTASTMMTKEAKTALRQRSRY